MKKSFVDHRFIEAPFGVFSRAELESLFTAKTKRDTFLGRNAIRLWLFLVNRTSGRETQGFEINQSCIDSMIPKRSSQYEAFADLASAGFIRNVDPKNNKWCLLIPVKKSEKTEVEEKTKSEKTEVELADSSVFSEPTLLDTIRLQELPLTPNQGNQEKTKASCSIKGEAKKTKAAKTKAAKTKTLEKIVSTLLNSDNDWRLIGRSGNISERRDTVIKGPPALLVRLSLHGGEDSVMRQMGYTGPLRQRVLLRAFESVLSTLKPITKESIKSIPSKWSIFGIVVDCIYNNGGDIESPSRWLANDVYPPADLTIDDLSTFIHADQLDIAIKMFHRYKDGKPPAITSC